MTRAQRPAGPGSGWGSGPGTGAGPGGSGTGFGGGTGGGSGTGAGGDGTGPGGGIGDGGAGTGGWVMSGLSVDGAVRPQALLGRMPAPVGAIHPCRRTAVAAAARPGRGLERTVSGVVVRSAASAMEAWARTITGSPAVGTPSTAVATASR